MKNPTPFFRLLNASLCIWLILLAHSVRAGDIKVYAAASMTNVLTELASLYRESHPEIFIKFSFAGSSILARQIENGAPADIFISADMEWAEYLQKKQLLDRKNIAVLVGNELVLVSPVSKRFEIKLEKSFDLVANMGGRICTGDPASVPVGKYAKQVFIFYGWWDGVQTKLVGTEDVRTALAFVERGECALGIVYKSDALLSNKIKILATFPGESHSLIQYPAGLIKPKHPEAKKFWDYLQSADAQEIFARYGFTALSNNISPNKFAPE